MEDSAYLMLSHKHVSVKRYKSGVTSADQRGLQNDGQQYGCVGGSHEKTPRLCMPSGSGSTLLPWPLLFLQLLLGLPCFPDLLGGEQNL